MLYGVRLAGGGALGWRSGGNPEGGAMDLSDGVPDDIDITRPSAARVYDYFLGGAHNFEVDRQLAEQIARLTPNLAQTMRANRSFLRRAVRYLIDEGIEQFLDLGSGIPTVGNVHEVAQDANPAARVVYVDIDPVAVAQSRAILDGNKRTGVVHADVREPDRIIAEAVDLGLVDLSQPLAVLLAGVLHFIPDADDPGGIAGRLRSAVVPGSFLLISHATQDGQPPEVLEAQRLSTRTDTEIFLRSHDRIREFFGDFTLVEPGLVYLTRWRPEQVGEFDEHPEQVGAYGGVARR
jgi:SAM-dependent methyltransferase